MKGEKKRKMPKGFFFILGVIALALALSIIPALFPGWWSLLLINGVLFLSIVAVWKILYSMYEEGEENGNPREGSEILAETKVGAIEKERKETRGLDKEDPLVEKEKATREAERGKIGNREN